jgi:hypothetical protein
MSATAARVRDRIKSLTVDDAIVAAAILYEVSAGHEDAADRLAVMARLADLDVPDLEDLCRRYGVDVDDDIRSDRRTGR